METNMNRGRFRGCIPSYEDANLCAAVMDTNRGQWQRPDIASKLITRPNMTVVDLGAGTGYFAALFSDLLPEGKIYALDPEKPMISWLEERKKRDSLDNVSICLIGKEDPGLDQLHCDVDLLFVGYTYFHFGNPIKYFHEKVYPFIQEKTVVAIADMAPTFGQGRHTVSEQQVIAEMTEACFRLQDEPTTLNEQYLINFKKIS
ncbi:MAG: methyltransferase domain-containing protein [Candidatus Scalindua sp. AMX11]|nr:MAG: methyltransferase domain-containing protein [Candidatus Scalindua sp.]NOG83145.1 methyltransferase domain-containing protein [Planctomycetota bacterium]RZV75842.1 MAG: methyltransferase domain-containing protein [Candidatus Scalindua sp. SCAELEC01]TDE64898.1 MAG: methyltransferase domain-containing protein [Candidatus Scalindua sp. AMX11]GJQ60366.1 MAG: hypothetical protein SCALA701_31670 [Candidatus Scalindua sp.]